VLVDTCSGQPQNRMALLADAGGGDQQNGSGWNRWWTPAAVTTGDGARPLATGSSKTGQQQNGRGRIAGPRSGCQLNVPPAERVTASAGGAYHHLTEWLPRGAVGS